MISVIFATYNGALYLEEQLLSVLNQTFADFEIVIVDDASKDSTISLAQSIFTNKNFTNYKIIQNSTNFGPTKSFEIGVNNSIGDFIAFCDQDDIWNLNKLEEFYSTAIATGCDLVTGTSYVMENGILTDKIFPMECQYSTNFGKLFHNRARGATMMIKRVHALKLIPFFDLYDKWIYINLVFTGKIVHIPSPLHTYRIHNDNVNGGSFRKRNIAGVIEVQENNKVFYENMEHYISNNLHKEYRFEKELILKDLRKLIRLHEITINSIISKNKIVSLIKYIQHVLFKELTITEKCIYFYYYILKFK